MPNRIEQTLGSDPNQKEEFLPSFWVAAAEEEGTSFVKVLLRRPALNFAVTLEGRKTLDDDEALWLSGPDIFEELITERKLLPGGEYEEVSFKALETLGLPPQFTYFVRLRVEQ